MVSPYPQTPMHVKHNLTMYCTPTSPSKIVLQIGTFQNVLKYWEFLK